jgi:hypothetical protein
MKTIATILALLTIVLPVFAQSESFPDWMDEVEFKRRGSVEQVEFNQLKMPIDPETGQPTTSTSSSVSKKFKRPSLPDFSKLREKAVKSNRQAKEKDSQKIAQALSRVPEQQKQLVKSRNHLSDLLKTLTDTDEKADVEQQKKQIDEKLNALEQFINLLNHEKQNLSQGITNLSKEDFSQALELQKLIFGKPSQSKKSAAKTNRKARQNQFYKPGKIKSFYLESQQNKQQEMQSD